MITDEQFAIMKPFLSGYLEPVKEILTKAKVTNRDGNPFTDQAISKVLNGKKQHAKIEAAIITVYEQRKDQQQDQDLKIKAPLKNGALQQ